MESLKQAGTGRKGGEGRSVDEVKASWMRSGKERRKRTVGRIGRGEKKDEK